jgi:ElaB/YqjD/DUF883 family membrane-anchored ribosome-binding protein
MATNDPFEPLTTGSTPGSSSTSDSAGIGGFGTTGNAGMGSSQRPPFDKEVHRRNLHDVQRAISREFQTLISDAENLLKQTTGSAGGQTEELRSRINANIERAKGLLKDSENALRDQGQAARQATEDYLQEHPWQSLGIAAGVGFLLGLLSAPRR